MPQLLQPSKIITKDGEFVVHLLIDLNINVNTSGPGVTIATKKAGSPEEREKEKEEQEWVVPTFGPAPKVKFGKTEDSN